MHGPEQEVIFPQQHKPAERAQSDFTHMEDLEVSIAGEPFPHMVFHLVFTYSNVEAVRICFSESFEALAEGIEHALWQIGGVPEQHRTDHLTAAVKQEHKSGAEDWTQRYQALMAHYGMQPTWNNTGIAHENGDVEQSHHRFKEAVDQALRVRGHRDFASRSAYEHFLQDLVYKRNQTRTVRFAEEKARLRPLPVAPLAPRPRSTGDGQQVFYRCSAGQRLLGALTLDWLTCADPYPCGNAGRISGHLCGVYPATSGGQTATPH